MTLRDKVSEAIHYHMDKGVQTNAVMEVLKDYEALVEAARKANEDWEADYLTKALEPFLPPPKLSDRLDELADSKLDSSSWFKELREIANQLKEQGL